MNDLQQRRADLVTKVKLVLAGAGVQPSSYAKTLSSVIGVAIAQAYRKLSGASQFTLPQIEAIELAYGVQLLDVRLDSALVPIKGIRGWTNAWFLIAGHKLPCRAILGGAQKIANPRYVAFLLRGEWNICLTQENGRGEPLFDVLEMALVTTGND